VRIAVVHDYFTQLGGAEKVAEELYNMLPGADLFATVALPRTTPESLKNVVIHTSWMQHLPKMDKLYRLYFLLYPFAVRSLDLSGYDLVITSSSGYVKGIRVDLNAIHICYCHTPMRWAWSFDSYASRERFGGGLNTLLSALIRALRMWDEGAARQPDHFIANSQVVADRILHAYGRYAEVIAPPIDVDRFRLSLEYSDYYIVLARLVSYKRIDVAVQAFTQLNKRLVVIGTGTAMNSLKADAGPTVQFTGRLSDHDVEEYVVRCRALIFPGEEDFGMSPLEVAAAGRPTIAFRAGGAVETIVENVSGLFFDEQTPESLIDAISRFENQQWSPQRIRQHAEGFSREVFRARMATFLERVGAPVEGLCGDYVDDLLKAQ
jgi:glycosyltransferase involved in cell wall biosynthesis